MCGIAGYIGRDKIDLSNTLACLDLMNQRGPDATGRWSTLSSDGTNIVFLHSRLSIIDIDERANQPFVSPNSDYSLTYNGEIYNYVEIRKKLSNFGINFRTESDTEVLFNVLKQKSIKLDELEGMWSFAFYDQSENKVILSRDRFGEKPLYYYEDQSGFYFGSEIKFIKALLSKKIEVNHEHLYRFLVNGYKSLYKKPHSFFNGIKEVSPGTILSIDLSNKKIQEKHFWNYSLVQDKDMSFEEAVEGARERLIQSMKIRMRSDVPLAFCLSGGVDSNSLISIASKTLGNKVHAFTVVNDDCRYEEQDMIDLSVRELDLDYTPISLDTTNFIENLNNLVRYHDCPVFTVTSYAQWLMMREISKAGYKVSVSGAAADELFTGYYDHHLLYLHDVFDCSDHYQASKDNWEKYVKPIVRNPYLQDADNFIKNPQLRDHIFLKNDVFQSFLTTSFKEDFQEERFNTSLLRSRMLNEVFHEIVPVLLHEEDLNAMYFSIENRTPFLDSKLFKFCQKIPTRHLVKDGRAKAVLREAIRGIAPTPIVENRRKVGFNAPLFSFLDVNNNDVKGYLLDNSSIFEHIDKSKVEELMKNTQLLNSESKFLFSFIGCKIFLEQQEGVV